VRTHGVPIPLYSSLRLGWTSAASLVRAWREWRPDVVQIATEGPLGWSALRAANRLSIPVATDFHTNFHAYSGDYGLGFLARAIAGYLRRFHNRAACTMVPTREMQGDLASRGFERLCVVGRGIDTALFTPARRSDALRRSWGCGPDTLVALHVGRLAPEKNLDLFFTAARAMQELGRDVRIVAVGDGPEAARRRAAHADCIFTGSRTGEDLAAHYASADVFLFPSLTETFGNVTLEAMASGLAVAAYDYAAAREYITDEQTGLRVPLGDEEAFLHAARRLAGHREMRERLRVGARALTESLSWSRCFDALEEVLDRTASAEPGSAGVLAAS
jgi:glycosyltransferase involved in cell wall biosynthesis